MKTRRRIVLLLATLLLAVLSGVALPGAPASGVGYLGADGDITVDNDFRGCGDATLPGSTLVVGQYSAVGVVVKGGVVHNVNVVRPINQPDPVVHKCNPAVVSAPTIGNVTYTLTVQASNGGGVSAVKNCTGFGSGFFLCVPTDN